MRTLLAAMTIAWCTSTLGAVEAAQTGDRFAGLHELLDTGRAEEARTKLAALREAFRRENNAELETVCLLFLASADQAAGDLPAARAHFDEAAKAFQARNDYFDS